MPAFETYEYGIEPKYLLPDALWEKIEPILAEAEAKKPPKKKAGRPRMDDRKALTAIFYQLWTDCQWDALPRSLGAKSTVHDRMEEWEEAKVYETLWATALEYYDTVEGIEWEWQAADGAMTKAPLGGEKHGGQPDRPGEGEREAERVDRWSGRSLGSGGRGSEPTRQQTVGSDLGKRPH
jgi:putative transposase